MFTLYGTVCWYVEKRGVYSMDTAKIEIRTPLKSEIYFQFVWKQQTHNRQHFWATHKICCKSEIIVKNCGHNRSTTDLSTERQKKWLESIYPLHWRDNNNDLGSEL